MVLTSTRNLCFEQKCEKYQNFLSDNFHFLVVKFLVYLNRRVLVMKTCVTSNDSVHVVPVPSMGTLFVILLWIARRL